MDEPVSCFECWWGDFNTDTSKHDIVEEPDLLHMTSPEDTKTVRVIQKCGLGQKAWKVNPNENFCPKWQDYKQMEARQKALASGALKAGQAAFEGTTSRAKIRDKSNMFTFMTAMMEDSDKAFEFLTDFYMFFGDTDAAGVLDFFGRLNDMNIRGRQIDVIIERWFPDGSDMFACSRFMELVKDKPQEVVDYVNAHFDKASEETAVVEGASLFGHV